MEFQRFSKNGELLPIRDAVVPLSSIEYQYGFGVYETMRVVNGVPYFLEAHAARLIGSARAIDLTHDFSEEAIVRLTQELIADIGAGTYNIKTLLIGGSEPMLYLLPLNPHFPDKKWYRDGVHTVLVHYERSYPHAKTLNMLGSYLAYSKAKAAGAYDALLVDEKGEILEGTRTNFFCISGKTLISPPEEKILLGVTRAAVLKVAAESGFELLVRDIHPKNLPAYEGAFLTSTSSGIMPIASIDDYHFGPQPEALKELMRALDSFLVRFL